MEDSDVETLTIYRLAYGGQQRKTRAVLALPYNQSKAQSDFMVEQIPLMEAEGLIEKCSNATGYSPLIVVRKPGSGPVRWRIAHKGLFEAPLVGGRLATQPSTSECVL